MDDYTLISNINKLKVQKNAIILAHNYQLPEVQQVADYVGDSLTLCRLAAESQKDIIIFCGVRFMAETAKLLSPQKTVLLPAIDAHCPMADMVDSHTLDALKQRYKDARVVCYVNSNVEIKAQSHICCTSSNAIDIVKGQKSDRIIFIPDKNLAGYVEDHVSEKEIIKIDGYCPIHAALTEQDVYDGREKYADAKVLVHPECTSGVRKLADFVGGTEAIIEYAIESRERDFLIGTECGVLYRLGKSCPDKNFYMLSDKLMCSDMKKITIKNIYNSLLWEKYAIEIDGKIHSQASKALYGMLDKST